VLPKKKSKPDLKPSQTDNTVHNQLAELIKTQKEMQQTQKQELAQLRTEFLTLQTEKENEEDANVPKEKKAVKVGRKKKKKMKLKIKRKIF